VRTSAASEHRLDRLVRRLTCTVLGHHYHVVWHISGTTRKVACQRCGRAWAMHDPTQSFIPWDGDFERLYARGGALNPSPPNSVLNPKNRNMHP